MNKLPLSPAHALHPSWTFLGWEPLRASFEYFSMHFMESADRIPGDGHPVVIFPGLASDKYATGPLTSFCERLGYEVHDWGRGVNTGPLGDVDEWLDELASHIKAMASEWRGDMSLIGWSLGGICAREVAKPWPRPQSSSRMWQCSTSRFREWTATSSRTSYGRVTV